MSKKTVQPIALSTDTGPTEFGTAAYFAPQLLVLLNKGIIIAFAHVRGGGEKGEDWHKAGFKTTKPNTWKDFIALPNI